MPQLPKKLRTVKSTKNNTTIQMSNGGWSSMPSGSVVMIGSASLAPSMGGSGGAGGGGMGSQTLGPEIMLFDPSTGHWSMNRLQFPIQTSMPNPCHAYFPNIMTAEELQNITKTSITKADELKKALEDLL